MTLEIRQHCEFPVSNKYIDAPHTFIPANKPTNRPADRTPSFDFLSYFKSLCIKYRSFEPNTWISLCYLRRFFFMTFAHRNYNGFRFLYFCFKWRTLKESLDQRTNNLVVFTYGVLITPQSISIQRKVELFTLYTSSEHQCHWLQVSCISDGDFVRDYL